MTMTTSQSLRDALRAQVSEIVGRLSPSDREALLLKCWMSHDARWFMAVCQAYGIEAANRLNKIAARELGKTEAQRVLRALQWPPVKSRDEYLLLQEIFIRLFGPDLLDYAIAAAGESGFRIDVQRCFAFDNVVRAGVADRYECGVFARVSGWLDALGLDHTLNPALGVCLLASSQPCSHTIQISHSGG